MLVQRCTLDQHRLIVPVSVTKPVFDSGSFSGSLSQNRYRALVDTGAQRTVISQTLIDEQRLMRVGHMEFGGLHGPKTHTRYLVSIGLWANRIEGVELPGEDSFAEQTLYSIEEPVEIVNMDDNENFDLIMGFDILKNFNFAFDERTKGFQLTVKP